MFPPAPQPPAGPSRPTPTPGRLTTSLSTPLFPFHRSNSTFPSAPTATSSSPANRSTTPLVPPTARIRSGSVFSREQYKKDEIARRRQESRDRLKSTWELLFEKYKDVEDDDEIDLHTMEITKDSGILRAQASRDFGRGGGSEDEEEEEGPVGGPEVYEFDSDEDELGDWDDRSGLDPQQPEWEEEEEEEEGARWTAEDREDFAEFMRMEEQRKRANGEDSGTETELDEESYGGEEGTRGKGKEPKREDNAREPTPPSPRSSGTRFLPVPTLADLFTSDDEQSSEDELQAINPLVDDEATRKTPAPPAVKPIETQSEGRTRRRQKFIVEVVIPTRRRSIHSSSARPPPLRDLTYHTLLGPTPSTSLPSPSLANLFTPPPTSPTSRPTLPHPSASPKGKKRMVGERPEDDARAAAAGASLPDSPYCKTIQRTLTGKLYQCVHCLEAGGERGERAEWCKGRRGDCPFESGPEKGATLAAPRPGKPAGILASAERGSESSTPRPARPPRPVGNSVGKGPICRLCREAGGDRAGGARACAGGKGWRRCPWEKKKAQAADGGKDIGGEHVEAGRDKREKRAVPLQAADPEQPATADETDEEDKPLPASRRTAKRVVRSVSDSDDHPRLIVEVPTRRASRKKTAPPNLAAPPSPPPTSSVAPSSPPRLSWSWSPLHSLPPSSPPVRVGDMFSPQVSRQHAHPTPSPSISASNVGVPSSPAGERALRAIPASSRASGPYRPTPSPSNDGLRSPSISSNPSTSAPRKSALRRPSEAPLQGPPSSVKRARFSIVPRSPVRDVLSSDDDDDDGSEDELDLLSSSAPQPPSSPVPGSSSPAPPRYASTFSPPRNELTVRAADVGFRLGPEHTGSLPLKMVQALAPSLGSFRRPAVGSSFPRLSGGEYALPTPPPSFGSLSSRPSPGAGAKSGLMLPPPVPAKRLSNPTSTPQPASPVLPSRSVATVVRTQARPRSESTSTPPTHPTHPRASRAPSTAPRVGHITPAPRATSEARRVQSTPTRKSRMVLRGLERAAAEAGDEAGLEWGLDEEADDGGRMWREGSVRTYVS
ncbi:hypothetical protein IAT38_004447 [Cryptococcus sp. DSM 104549]